MQKKVLLCVSGGIAAYKAVQLTSKLTQNGFDVKVMMTGNATKFVTPLSFQAISRNDVYTDTFDEKDPAKIAHIDLADWPDVIIIAPATANIIGKLANGIADDMVSTTLLATEKPVFIAPAMNVHMYNHPVVQENIARLKSFGYHFIEPSEGYLACGYVGKGRLEEPEIIVEHVKTFFVQNKQQFLRGKTVLISAGPTREKIDPVRYLSNYSSGKMGYAIAEVAQHLGANVILISGPVSLKPPVGVQIIRVESAEEMYEAVLQYFDEADIVIKSAAVSDYRPKKILQQKMKKQSQELVIELERTVDILAELGKRKKAQFLIGFAAETNHVEEYAKQKLLSKNADMIVANNVMQEGAGFGTDTNIVTFYKANNEKKQFPKLTKHEVAYEILKEAYEAKKGE
ncbi:bifunctional phosphopantothenoylcysteine decarboxylase/phosphopantothenate--cysteine ligase CoaBC [Caldifermentibacillus hisashii]|uniref:bifunctional phosphopantothenoylcysteine decarboxylase/phosphopantothenate--cysteine ligase CoaBC n=1 Tax=Caldifermentibacillus hisashii TaxID=996558 RepID=UPI001C128C0B|nr:bifunctional phosphopantothenoylcysteine decarboxylase/phosphopantothenate--cysteine ligase CoaBC [Caldifermentibacillus hisashii]MBU5341174.1 bifunctional phosphopantothenoylcysteine decarboxylase/phosphopantothenate--cysteine ligase CoaBC [Caldifermentibacillus hisashii]